MTAKIGYASDPVSSLAPGWQRPVLRGECRPGWLHCWRYRKSPEKQGHAELARALLCLEPASDDFHTVPAELNP